LNLKFIGRRKLDIDNSSNLRQALTCSCYLQIQTTESDQILNLTGCGNAQTALPGICLHIF
jgi:hypothetical protein